jgi:FecR protein
MLSAWPSLLRFLAILLFLASTFSAWAADNPSVGMVTKVENEAQVVSSDGTTAAKVGTVLHMKDELHTGAKGRLQVTFRDKTMLTLGENASVVIDRYVFDPDESTGEAVLDVTQGAFRFATGRLKEMRQKKITISTPVAQIGVRGTTLAGAQVDRRYAYSVLLYEGGPVTVGKFTLSHPLWCIDLGGEAHLGEAHLLPYKCPPDRVALFSEATAIGPGQGGENYHGGENPNYAVIPLLAPLLPLTGMIVSTQTQPASPTETRPASP